jgi:hypothetical protein
MSRRGFLGRRCGGRRRGRIRLHPDLDPDVVSSLGCHDNEAVLTIGGVDLVLDGSKIVERMAEAGGEHLVEHRQHGLGTERA